MADKDTQELDLTSSSALIELIGGYAIQNEIGGGGAGRVFRCRDLDLARDVAIKILHEDLLTDDVAVQRFTREAQVLARIDSPHVVKVYQAGMRGKVPYIVMELVDGKNAEEALKHEGKLDVTRALKAARDTALALVDAHKVGVIHRDVKPSNIILPSSTNTSSVGAKLTDFGLAAEVEGSAKLTMAGMIAGTAAFLAPERVRGKSDARSDIYSLGCTLYTLIAGVPPFVRDVPIEVITAHLNDPAPKLDAGGRDDVAELVAKMMSKDPDKRPQTAEEVVRALDMLILNEPDASASPKAAELARRLEEVLGEEIPPAPSLADVSPGLSSTSELPAPAPAIATGVNGSLRRMGVPELLQTLEQSASTASVALGKLDGTEGFIGVKNGRLVFARCGAVNGAEAFFELVTWRDGHFQIQYDRDPAETNIDASTQGLLLEAFRRLDESAPVVSPAAGGVASATVASVASTANLARVSDVVGAVSPVSPVSPTANTVVPEVSASASPSASAQKTAFFGSQTYDASGTSTSTSTSDAPINETRPLGIEMPINETRPLGVEKPDFDKTLDTSAPVQRPPTPSIAERAAPLVGGGQRVIVQMRAAAQAKWRELSPRGRAITAAAGGALGVLLMVAAFTGGGGGSARPGEPAAVDDDRMERIAEGKAREVLKEIDATPPGELEPVDELVRGHALVAIGDNAEALAAFLRAVKRGETDDASLAYVMKAINKSPADDAIEVLAAWPKDDIRATLEATVAKGDWWERHHALIALEKRKQAQNVDVTALAIRDLNEGPTCNKRKHGLTMLRESGKGKAALQAIDQASRRRDNNECMRFMDFAAAKQGVQGR